MTIFLQTSTIGMHYGDLIMGTVVSQITSLTIVYSIIYSDAGQRKHQWLESLAFVRGIHQGPVNSLHKWPVTRKMFPFDDIIMWYSQWVSSYKSFCQYDWWFIMTLTSSWIHTVDVIWSQLRCELHHIDVFHQLAFQQWMSVASCTNFV